MGRRDAWLLLLPLVAVAVDCGAGPPAVDRPNLVVIVGDDHGYPDSGFMGNEVVKTPHLDRLAAEGTVFSNVYNVASSCRASLMGMLTGLDPYQVDLRTRQLAALGRSRNEVNRILDFETLPGLLSRRGYRSFQAGKHWEGTAAEAGFTAGTKTAEDVQGARSRGIAGVGGGDLELGRTTMQPVWDLLEQADGDPFLLWFAPMLPHRPMNAPRPYWELYDPKTSTLEEIAYYANVSRLDEAIGELLQRLDDMGLRERTLVVYVSDNGWQPTAQPSAEKGNVLGGRQGKMSMYELGFRTPVIFHWPGHVPAGVVHDELASTLDLLPTLLDYAGLVAPPGRFGVSLEPVIEGRAPAASRALYGWMGAVLPASVEVSPRSRWERRRRAASFARRDQWHYFAFETAKGALDPEDEALFDLEQDPDETRDVAAENPELVAALGREIAAWKRQARHSLPRETSRTSSWTPLE